jgi:hypothetical protein
MRKFINGVRGAGALLLTGTLTLSESNDTSWGNIAFFADKGGFHSFARLLRVAGPEYGDTWVFRILLGLVIVFLIWPFIEPLWHYLFSGGQPPSHPDMPIHEAFDYIVNDSRTKLRRPGPPVRMSDGPASGRLVVQGGVEHDDAFERVIQALSLGKLRAWGRKPVGFFSAQNFTTDLKEIPKAYWNSATLRHPFCFHSSEQVQSRSLDGSNEVPLYRNITLDKKEVVSIWPPKCPVRRWIARLRKRPRIRYHGLYDVP